MPKFLIKENQPLSEYSTFGIGGPARYFTEVDAIEDLKSALAFCLEKNLPFHVIGKGSNSLFDDRGFNGLAILNKLSFFEIEGSRVTVGSGYNFSLLGIKTAKKGLSGLEFASGIPASVGGAIFMNAGANGAETKDTLEKVTFVHANGQEEVFEKKDLEFSYRYSSFQEMKGCIASASFFLQHDQEARDRQLEIISYRTKTQPLKERSCGCVFRNPSGQSAGVLIEQCGLKGLQIGDAKVSTLHANFLINSKSARAQDVIALAESIKACVKEETGVDLEFELRRVPFQK